MSADIPTMSTPLGSVQIRSVLSYQTRNLKEAHQSFQGCGDTNVNCSAPVSLPEEFKDMNKEMLCKDPQYLERLTRDQSASALWYEERKKKLTSSNFGRILKRKASPTDKFLQGLFSYKQANDQSLDYGRRHEKHAKEKYLEKFPSRHLHECGLVVNNEFSFIGASPDGKLCDEGSSGMVEIKCPFSARNMTILEACDEISDFCLEETNGSISLKKGHNYFLQIQGQLLVTGCEYCEFIVFTQKDLHVERITPDFKVMEQMLIKLAKFYRDFALPLLKTLKNSC